MKCHKCRYEWNYNGKKTIFVTCPNCLTKVKIIPIMVKSASLRSAPAVQPNGFSPWRAPAVSVTHTNLNEEELDFANKTALKLRYVKKDDWDTRIAELFSYCEENNIKREIAEFAINQAKEMKLQYANQQ